MTPEEREKLVFVALSIETTLEPEALLAYEEKYKFPFIHAVMTEEFAVAWAEAVGKEGLVPPMTPHLIIDETGTPGELQIGTQEPEEIATELRAAIRGE